jgi:ABC-2 type transport system permease protein
MLDIKVIKAVAKKEIRQLSREKRMLFVVFFFPLFLLIIFGYAINLDVKHIKLAVLDYDKTKETRTIVTSLVSSEYFDLVGYLDDYSAARDALNRSKAQLVVVFPRNFSKQIYRLEGSRLQFLIDGINGNTSSVIFNYSNLVANYYLTQWIRANIFPNLVQMNFAGAQIEPRFWYNPELKSNIFLVPGLIGIIIILTSAITVSLSIVREKERNTIEQILISPISPADFIVGKVFPYLLIALINSSLVIVFGHIIFGVPLRGNLLYLFFAMLLYIYSSVSIGVFVSVVADNQLLAFLMVVIISVLPSMLLSGFIFPIESMPLLIQLITNLTPAKFFLSIIRGLLLKGIGIQFIWMNFLYLFVYGSIFLLLSFAAYRKSFKLEL